MSDHERSPKRQRSSLGSGNPHPSTAAPSSGEPRPPRGEALSPEDVARAQELWLELHDIGLVVLHFPVRWRAALELSIRLYQCETECRRCWRKCLRPDYDGCPILRVKIGN